jgi:hypothetical protein
MPAMPAPAAGELASLLEYLRYQHQAFFVTSYGLTDEQARCIPSPIPLLPPVITATLPANRAIS